MKKHSLLLCLLAFSILAISGCSEKDVPAAPLPEPDLGFNGFELLGDTNSPASRFYPPFDYQTPIRLEVSTTEEINNLSQDYVYVRAHIESPTSGNYQDYGALTLSSAVVPPEVATSGGETIFIYRRYEWLNPNIRGKTIVVGLNSLWAIPPNEQGIPPFQQLFYSYLPLQATANGLAVNHLDEYIVSGRSRLSLEWQKEDFNDSVAIEVAYNITLSQRKNPALPGFFISYITKVPDNGRYTIPPAVFQQMPVGGIIDIMLWRYKDYQFSNGGIPARVRTESFSRLSVEMVEQ